MKAQFIKVLVLLLMIAGMPQSARAQQEHMDMTKIQEIPDYGAEMPNEEFLARSELYEEFPQGDRFIAYKVRLPKGWFKAPSSVAQEFKKDEMQKANLSQRILGLIAKFYGPGRIDELSRFEIQAQSLEYEVTAKNWFMQEVLTRGYVLEGIKVISDKRVEAQYVTVEKDTAFVVRSAAEINGPRMIVASYYVPDAHWEAERVFQQRAIESFQFVTPEKSKIEMTRRHAFLDLLSFEYPASWRLTAPQVYSVEGMEASLVNSIDEKTLAGEIHISILSTEYESALQDELSFLKQEITNRGLKLGDLLETRKEYTLPTHIHYNHTEVYKAFDEDEKVLGHEYWVGVLEEDRYFYVVTMLTPARDSEFYTWARNAEAYQTVVQSFEP